MGNFDKEKPENQDEGALRRPKYNSEPQVQYFKVQAPFTYDRKYYPGQDIALSDPQVIKNLKDQRMIK